ncbi:19445_t:CDS:2 [Dentiscutata erythropus]|uniref:19445_t:CDS:1 n=1 Tax=Dentiscutata erythropus TaxID=1348616 RepID=A0A9N9ASQ0_9GLOM|nr:19445_t:CDS:2 [Dentiscutata erythropus]
MLIALGMRIHDVFPGQGVIHTNSQLNKIMATGKGIYFFGEAARFGRDEYSHYDAMTPIFKSDGTICAVFALIYDTTQKIINTRRLKTLGEFGKHISG